MQSVPEKYLVVRLPTCPICDSELSATAATESQYFPFCTERCRNVDLLRWSDGKYAIVEPLSQEQLAEKQLADELDGELDSPEYH